MKVKVCQCRPIKYKFPIVAWLIMLFQGMLPWKASAYSHIAVTFKDLHGMIAFSDASGKGIRTRYMHHFLKEYKTLKEIELDIMSSPTEFDMEMRALNGTEYDHHQMVGLFLRCLGMATLNKFGHNYKKMICNELPLMIVKEHTNYGFRIGDPDNYGLVDTWQFLERITKA